jgi:hypothetical protein
MPTQPRITKTATDRSATHTEASADHSGRIKGRVIKVGDKVRIERDETRHPSRGTWPQFRGKTGTVVEINRAGRGPTEYGVCFTKVSPGGPRSKRAFTWDQASVAWFKRHEIVLTEDVA